MKISLMMSSNRPVLGVLKRGFGRTQSAWDLLDDFRNKLQLSEIISQGGSFDGGSFKLPDPPPPRGRALAKTLGTINLLNMLS